MCRSLKWDCQSVIDSWVVVAAQGVDISIAKIKPIRLRKEEVVRTSRPKANELQRVDNLGQTMRGIAGVVK